MDVLPMSIIYVAMLATNNLCLNYVEVSFFQVPFQGISICIRLLIDAYFLTR